MSHSKDREVISRSSWGVYFIGESNLLNTSMDHSSLHHEGKRLSKVPSLFSDNNKFVAYIMYTDVNKVDTFTSHQELIFINFCLPQFYCL